MNKCLLENKWGARIKKYFLEELELGLARAYRICDVTGRLYSVIFHVAQWERWQSEDALLQDAFADFSDEQREFLLSGLTPAEWNEMAGPENPTEDEPENVYYEDDGNLL